MFGDVGDVLLVQLDVVARPEPAEVTTDQVLPLVAQRMVRRGDIADPIFGEVEVVDGHPAGIDDVDQHQRVVVGEVDVAVVRRVIGPVPRKLDAFTADLERAAILEGLLGSRAGRIVVAQQEPPRLLVSDANDAVVEQ